MTSSSTIRSFRNVKARTANGRSPTNTTPPAAPLTIAGRAPAASGRKTSGLAGDRRGAADHSATARSSRQVARSARITTSGSRTRRSASKSPARDAAMERLDELPLPRDRRLGRGPAPRTRRRARLASFRVAVGVRSTIGAISSNGRPNVSWRTNASRSAGDSVSRTMSIASPTDSARSAWRSGSDASAAATVRRRPQPRRSSRPARGTRGRRRPRGGPPGPAAGRGTAARRSSSASRRGCRRPSASARLARSQASWTASSASAERAQHPVGHRPQVRRGGPRSARPASRRRSSLVHRSRSSFRVRQSIDEQPARNVTDMIEEPPMTPGSGARPRLQPAHPPAPPDRPADGPERAHDRPRPHLRASRGPRPSRSPRSTADATSSAPTARSTGFATCAPPARPTSTSTAGPSTSGRSSSIARRRSTSSPQTLPGYVARLPRARPPLRRVLFRLAAPEVLSDPARAAATRPVFELLAV